MVLQGDASFGVGAKAGPLMELRSRNIGTPLVVKEVAVYSYDAIKNLREVTVLNDDFKLVPLASELGSAFRSGIDIIEISCAVLLDGRIWVAFCRIGSIIEDLHFKSGHPAIRVLLSILVDEVDDAGISAFANFPFPLEVEVFKFPDRTVNILVHDIATTVDLPVLFVARVQMQGLVFDDPRFANHRIAVLAEIAGALAVEQELPAFDDFGFGDVIVQFFRSGGRFFGRRINGASAGAVQATAKRAAADRRRCFIRAKN